MCKQLPGNYEFIGCGVSAGLRTYVLHEMLATTSSPGTHNEYECVDYLSTLHLSGRFANNELVIDTAHRL